MLRIIGFILEFKNKASKEIKRISTDILKLDKIWEKSSKVFSKWGKRIGLEFDVMRARFVDIFSKIKDKMGDLDTALDKLDDVVGVRVGSIIRTLTKPRVALAGLFSFAAKAGVDFENSLRKIRIEGGYTEDQMMSMRGEIRSLVKELGHGFREIGEVMLIFARRGGLAAEEARRLGRVALMAQDITGAFATETADLAVKLQRLYNLTAREMEALIAGSIRAGQELNIPITVLLESLTQVDHAIIRLPESVRKRAIPQLIQAMAAFRGAYIDNAEEMMIAITRGMVDSSSEAFRQINFIVSRGLPEMFSTFRKEVDRGNFAVAMDILSKAIRSRRFDMEELLRVESAMGSVLFADLATLYKIGKISSDTWRDVASSFTQAASDASWLKGYWGDTLSLSMKLSKLWGRVWNLISRLGEPLVRIGHVLADLGKFIFDYIIDPVMEVAGGFLSWVTVLLGISFILGGISVLLGIIGGVVSALLSPIGLLVAAAVLLVKLFPGILDAIKAVASVVIDIVKYLAELLYGIGKIIVSVIVGAIIGLGVLIYRYLIEPVAKLLHPAFQAVWGVIKSIGEAIYSVGVFLYDNIISPVLGFINDVLSALDSIKDWLSNAGTSIFHFLTFGIFEDEKKVPGAAEGALVMPTPGGTVVQVAEGGSPEIIADPKLMRDLLGVDDIVEAIWGSARFLAEAISKNPVGFLERSDSSVPPPPTSEGVMGSYDIH